MMKRPTEFSGVVDGVPCRIEQLSSSGACVVICGPTVFTLHDRVALAFELAGQAFELSVEVRRIHVESGATAWLEFVGNSARSIDLLSEVLV